MKDLTGTQCAECEEGALQETSIQDDRDGVLHCTNCGIKVVRHCEEGGE